jgi:hypothetical protein
MATKSSSSNSSLSITVPAAGVTSGDTVVVSAEVGTTRGVVGCRDSRGNTYTVDADVQGVGRLFVCSGRATVGLQPGDTITAFYPSFSGMTVASATEFSGITGLDRSRAAIGNSAKPSSGAITTTRPDTLVISVIGHNSPSVFTHAGGFTAVSRAIVGSGSNQKTIDVGYQYGPSPGTFTGCGTLSASSRWRAVVVAYY